MKKKIAFLLVAILSISLFMGCKALIDKKISLQDITVTIPKEYSFDKNQSEDNYMVFQQDGYFKSIVLTCDEAIFTAQEYIEAMSEAGITSQTGKLGQLDCIYSNYDVDGKVCQEALFFYGSNVYAVSIRGGEDGEFQSLLDSLQFR